MSIYYLCNTNVLVVVHLVYLYVIRNCLTFFANGIRVYVLINIQPTENISGFYRFLTRVFEQW